MTISDAYKIIKDEFYKILVSSLVVGVMAAGYSLTISDVFRATVIISSSKPDLNLDNIAFNNLIGSPLLTGTSSTHQDIKAIFGGNKIYKDFILEEDILKIIFEDDWNENSKSWVGREKDIYDGIKVLKDSTDLNFSFDDGKTYLSFTWTNSEIASNWANNLASRANDFITNNELNSINKTLQNLNKISKQDIFNNSLRNELDKQLNELVIKTTLKKAESSMGLTIFEEAIPPKKRIWPKRTLTVILALLVGGFGAAAFFIIRRLIKEE
tara:strand:- start:12281 stop:13087 length:807 start_codon:yes stop_codon:yes gene_type:complete